VQGKNQLGIVMAFKIIYKKDQVF